MLAKTVCRQIRIDANSKWALQKFADALYMLISNSFKNNDYKSIVFVCIGTDRSTGDSLGPLVGYKINDINYKMFMSMVIWMNLFMQRTLTRLWNKFSSAMTDLWSLPLMPVLEEWTMWVL